MTDMVRKQIYISRRQQELLKTLSKERGISEAEIIRQAIDRESANAMPKTDLGRREAWEKTYQFMLSLRERTEQFSEPYHWNREEIYEERLSRFDRPPGEV